MNYEINGKKVWLSHETKIKYSDFQEALGITLSTDGNEMASGEKMKVAMLGVNHKLGVVLIEPRILRDSEYVKEHNCEWYDPLPTKKTHGEQIEELTDEEVPNYISPRGKQVNMSEKTIVDEISVKEWLHLTNSVYQN
jgi:hypothetical protein